VDPRSDIFSLGVVLYEMLVRRTPFERAGDNTVFAVLHRIAGEPHAPVTTIDPQIPAAFNAILERALAKSPDKRYQRAGDMANDLRNFKALAGSMHAPDTDSTKTIAISRPQLKPEKSDPATTTLIDDLDVFAKDFEKYQQETLRAEAAERLRKEEEIQRWAAAEEKRREEFDREREAKSGVTQLGSTKKSAAFELLRQKAAGKTAAVTAEQAKKVQAVAILDERLRSAFRYLSEFATMLNEAKPVSDGKQGVMFFGDRTGMILDEGFSDMRTRDLHGKSCADYVTFKYRVHFPKPEKLEVAGQEAERIQERLKTLGIKHEFAASKNAAGQVARATFVLTGPFPCQAVLRADYDEPGISIDLVNVRHHGPAKLRLQPEELNDEVLDEFGTWVLGADEAFERFLRRKS
jgi:hypothetical protein